MSVCVCACRTSVLSMCAERAPGTARGEGLMVLQGELQTDGRTDGEERENKSERSGEKPGRRRGTEKDVCAAKQTANSSELM